MKDMANFRRENNGCHPYPTADQKLAGDSVDD